MASLIAFLLILHLVSGYMNTTDLLELLENNRCGSMELCLDTTERRPGVQCQCGPDCRKYRDCCRDSPFFRPEDVGQKVCKTVYRHDSNFTIPVSMVGFCPPEWIGEEREGCQHPKILGQDPLKSGIPVTDTSTEQQVTYMNVHCAVCNNANLSSLLMWKAKLRCQKVKGEIPTMMKKLQLETVKNRPNKVWSFSENGIVYPCTGLIPVSPPGLENLRTCPYRDNRLDFYDSCRPGWEGTRTGDLCKSYTAYVFVGRHTFQNAHCAECQDFDLNDTQCYPPISGRNKNITSHGIESTAFQELLDFEFMDTCNKYEVFDPFSKRCRRFLIERPAKLTVVNRCANKFAFTNETYFLSTDNLSVWVPVYNKTYGKGEFFFVDNKLAICLEEGKAKLLESVLTFFGLGISIIFLTLHLCAVALVPELRNLSGRTLASLCVALLFGYISFIVAGILEPEDKPFCAIASVSKYYFFLSAFTWMLVIGFDVWRALIQAVHFQSCRGGQWHRFLAYSAFAWLTPAIMTALAVAADNAPEDLMNEDLRPAFGVKKCWFSHRIALGIFFGAPLLLIMIFNIGFFASAAWMTMGTRPCGMSAGASGARRDFRLYLRLAVMLGLTWVVGLLAMVLSYSALWMAFNVLNTLQGLFIFVMFTCTAKVFRGLGKVLPWTESFPYSFSSRRDKRSSKTQTCVAASSDTLQDSAFGSSSDKEQNPELNTLFPKRKLPEK